MMRQNIVEILPQLLSSNCDLCRQVGGIKELAIRPGEDEMNLIVRLRPTNKDSKRKHYQVYLQTRSLNGIQLAAVLKSLAVHAVFLTELKLVKLGLEDSCMSLIRKAGWKFVRAARFSKNCITWKGAREVARCSWKYLQQLQLNSNPIRNKGVEELCKAEWPSLRHLHLCSCGVDDSSMKALCKGLINKLVYVDLSNNLVSNNCFRFLSAASISHLREFNIQSPAYSSCLPSDFPVYIFKMACRNEVQIELHGQSVFVASFFARLQNRRAVRMRDE